MSLICTPASDLYQLARETLAAVKPGESAAFEMPKSRFWRNEGRNAVSNAATQIFGSGRFRMDSRSAPGQVVITHKPVEVSA